MRATNKPEIDNILTTMRRKREVWAQLDLDSRIEMVETLLAGFSDNAQSWVDASYEAKGVKLYPPGQGQEWMAGPSVTIRNLRLLRETLIQIRDKGKPILPGRPNIRPDGQVVVPVFPTSIFDRLLFAGTKAEVWMAPGVTAKNLNEHMAVAYRTSKQVAEICLVLGAGNVSSIAPMDCFYKLFVEKKLVILKIHPVNEYLGPVFERAFQPLITEGFVGIVYGDVEQGDYLCKHEAVDEIHITGSDKTHDIIVYGSAEQKAKREPINNKPISSELGNVSPMIVAPARWSRKDLRFQAENVVSSLVNNAGFNCNATRVLITHAEWPQREDFLNAIREEFRKLPTRLAYYPGADSRFEAFQEAHPEAELFGEANGRRLPWMFIPNVASSNREDICFQKEAFCGVFAETALSADSVAGFLDQAVDFANDTTWGTLNVTMLVHPKIRRNPKSAEALERAVANLRFGTVSINHWAAIGYALCSTTWGAYPGHEIHDIQSGRDVVHNTYMLDKVQKSVVHGPFRVTPKPAWFVGNKMGLDLGRRLVAFEAKPSFFRLPGMIMDAIRG